MSEEPTPAPSSLPIALRRSFQLDTFEVFLLGVGAWLLVGTFSGFDSVVGLARGQVGGAYLLFSLLILPSILTQVELRHWVRESGGSYRLLQRLGRPAITFLAGWTYLLAWAGLSGLVAWSFSGQVADLIAELAGVTIERWPLLLGFVTLYVALNSLGQRPAWAVAVRSAGLVAMGLVILVLTLARQLLPGSDSLPTAAASGNLFAAVATLGGGLWIIEILAERRRADQVLRVTLFGTVFSVLLGAALGFVGVRVASAGLSLKAMGELALPGAGGYLTLGAGALLTLLLWQALSLIMLRQLQSIGGDGVLPEWMLKGSPKRGYPIRLSGLQAALTLAVLAPVHWLFSGHTEGAIALGSIAAAAMLLIQFGVSLTSILLARQRDSASGGFRLPLFPALPAAGAGISFLLLLALPGWARGLLVAWLIVGALLFWQWGRKRMHAAQLGVTVFQDEFHKPGLDSEYPVLVPISNPETAASLVSLGAAIAKQRQGHLLLLQVILVPEHLSLDRRRFEARKKHDLLEQLIAQAEAAGVPVEGETRLARNVTQGILDTVAEESVRLVVMGSKIRPQVGSSGFGEIVDAVLESAVCEVAVASGDGEISTSKLVVPVSSAEEGAQAAKLALAITAQSNGHVRLVHVSRSVDGEAAELAGKIILDAILERLDGAERISADVIPAGSPLEGIMKASEGSELVLLGASEQGLLDEEHFGPVALQLAMRSEIPMLLMRSQAALPTYFARRAWRSLTDLLPRLSGEEQVAVYRRMRVAARPSVNYFVLITLSAVIASLGLLLNSPAVVIGAMLVAPLMSPIVATAVGITFGDAQTLRDSLSATVQGMLAAVFIAILMTLAVPGAEATSEVLARAHPTLIDLIVALASGMAGAYAIARKEVGEALPGVAIAAALLPPLASVGIGIALADASIAGGALLLFVTNLIAIIFASALVFLLLGVRPPKVEEREERLRQGLVISVISLILVSLPLAYFLWQAVQRESVETRTRAVVERRAEAWGAVGLDDFTVVRGRDRVSVEATLLAEGTVSEAELLQLEQELSEMLEQKVTVRLFVLSGKLVPSVSP